MEKILLLHSFFIRAAEIIIVWKPKKLKEIMRYNVKKRRYLGKIRV